MEKVKKYINVPKQAGIRKYLATGKYQALKKIKGKQYSETFDTIREAQHWRNVFDGTNESLFKTKSTSTLGYVFERMQKLHYPSLEISTQRIWSRRFKPLEELKNYHMEEITSTVINRWIDKHKKIFSSDEYLAGRGRAGRCNLYNELNLLRTIFNWYKSEDEFEGESKNIDSPIRLRHKKMAFIREPSVKPEQRKITVEAAFQFFSALPEIYADLAMFQFYCAGRIGETAGVQISNIYLKEEYFMIKDTISWCNGSKTFEYLKPFPKNREARRVHIHAKLREIIDRRLKLRVEGCNYLFQLGGKPLNYCTIQANYRAAQTRTGIPYRGTHCLRHGMATLARKVGGSGLDSVVAMTGHKDLKLADHYSKIDGEVQKDTSLKILEHIESLNLYGSETGESAGDFAGDICSELASNVIPLKRFKGI